MSIREMLYRWYPLVDPALQVAANKAVKAIEANPRKRAVVEREGNISFCPRCGQIPARDYRHEEAFALVLRCVPTAKPSDIRLAIEIAHKVCT